MRENLTPYKALLTFSEKNFIINISTIKLKLTIYGFIIREVVYNK